MDLQRVEPKLKLLALILDIGLNGVLFHTVNLEIKSLEAILTQL